MSSKPTVLIPVDHHKALLLNINPDDLVLYESHDPEDGSYHTIYLFSAYVGSTFAGDTPENRWEIVKNNRERLINISYNPQRLDEMRDVVRRDDSMRAMAVAVLRDIYQSIADKLNEDLRYNLRRAHHAGLYNYQYDRVAVANAIENWLISLDHPTTHNA